MLIKGHPSWFERLISATLMKGRGEFKTRPYKQSRANLVADEKKVFPAEEKLFNITCCSRSISFCDPRPLNIRSGFSQLYA